MLLSLSDFAYGCIRSGEAVLCILLFFQEFIFEKSFVKRITKYKDSEFTVELPLFTQEEMQEFIDEKLSRLRGTSKK